MFFLAMKERGSVEISLEILSFRAYFDYLIVYPKIIKSLLFQQNPWFSQGPFSANVSIKALGWISLLSG